ncbi:serine dehydratase subunit alpha family protein [Wukongibacter baidiensis]|uniref:L-cysteine desulfidase family protein n=1 Tax=Wukongibacter baidiensis TaxID=1723361 RepID=UPI003D7FE1E6
MELRNLIVKALKEEVVPAMGCTEPVAVALAGAKAKELIDFQEIDRVQVFVSPNIYKNGLAVGIPNTEEVGLYIAAALGLIGGKSEKDLKVLEGIEPNDVKVAKDLLESGKLSLDIKATKEKIYIEVELFTDGGSSKVVIKGKHNRFVYLEKQGEVILDEKEENAQAVDDKNAIYNLKIREIIHEIEQVPYEDIKFMLDGLEMNEKIAQTGLKQNTGIGVGFTFLDNIEKGILSNDLMNQAMMLTAAASDARMSGVSLPVMSSNGSGNNGLTVILPIVAYKEKFQPEDEKIARALAISHIINSYIKYYIGRLSALCGCGVAAGTGSAVGIAWLMGANDEQIDGVIKNMLANTSGMICDGAKVGCALKLATSASAAVQSALLAIGNNIVPSQNGIVAETAEETIKNLGTLSDKGMNTADEVILRVMKEMQAKSNTNLDYSNKQNSIA